MKIKSAGHLLLLKKNAFSLVELVIVIIIVGVLSSLALVRFFKLTEFSRSVEGIDEIRVIRNSIERCYMMTQDYQLCLLNSPGPGSNTLDVEDPGLTPGTHFTYKVNPMGTPFKYRITATRNTLDGGAAGDIILFTYRENGVITRSGTGAFVGIK